MIRCREGKKFEQKYLRKGFAEKISVIRILDSRREKFKIGKAYEHKIDLPEMQGEGKGGTAWIGKQCIS